MSFSSPQSLEDLRALVAQHTRTKETLTNDITTTQQCILALTETRAALRAQKKALAEGKELEQLDALVRKVHATQQEAIQLGNHLQPSDASDEEASLKEKSRLEERVIEINAATTISQRALDRLKEISEKILQDTAGGDNIAKAPPSTNPKDDLDTIDGMTKDEILSKIADLEKAIKDQQASHPTPSDMPTFRGVSLSDLM